MVVSAAIVESIQLNHKVLQIYNNNINNNKGVIENGNPIVYCLLSLHEPTSQNVTFDLQYDYECFALMLLLQQRRYRDIAI